MIDKSVLSVEEAVAGIPDGATVMIGGFGRAGQPVELIDALIAQGATGLTIVNNNAGNGDTGLAALLAAGRVRKIICSFPRQADSWVFDGLYRAGEIELELVPQGNLAERIRAAGAGIGAFYSPTAVGTQLADGKEVREIDGKDYLLEYPIRADFALISAFRADRWGLLKVQLSPGFMPPKRRHPSLWPRTRPVSASRACAACVCGDISPRSMTQSRAATLAEYATIADQARSSATN